ncbi:MAG: alpha/beta fold hydrolase [bacterium]
MRSRLIVAAIVVAAVGTVASTPSPKRLLHEVEQAATRDTSPSFRVAATLVPGQFNGRTFTDGGVLFRYQLFLPRNFDPSKKWPVVVALHGSAEKGNDGVRQMGVGVGKFVRANASTYQAVVLLPQVPGEGKILDWTPSFTRLIDSVVHEVNGDPDRVYLTGFSMGGILAYDIIYRHPGKFAAVINVSAPVVIQPTPDRASRWPTSESHPAEARALGRTPIWIFQGAHDEAALATDTRHLVAALQAAHVPVKYTEYADGAHDVWDRAYQTQYLWEWLLAQHR